MLEEAHGVEEKRLREVCEAYSQMKTAHMRQLQRLITIDEDIQAIMKSIGLAKVWVEERERERERERAKRREARTNSAGKFYLRYS